MLTTTSRSKQPKYFVARANQRALSAKIHIGLKELKLLQRLNKRFWSYGMRTLLTLFLVKSLMMGDSEASLIYGAYTGLVYAAPILGGRMADKYLGYRYAVMLGAILMAIGEFLILGESKEMLYIGMGALIIGNGYFKANISTIVGKLYEERLFKEPRLTYKDG